MEMSNLVKRHDNNINNLLFSELNSCLDAILQHFQCVISTDSLIHGLPIKEKELTPDLIIRALNKAGLNTNIKTRKLKNIQENDLPGIIILNNNRACFVTEVTPSKQWKILDPNNPNQTIDKDPKAFIDNQAGYFIHVSMPFKSREKNSDERPKRFWLWEIFSSSWPLYSEVLLASFFINMFAIALPLFIMNVYDKVIPNNAVETLTVLAVGVFLAFICDFILKNLRGHFIDESAKNIDTVVLSNLYEKIMNIRTTARPQSSGTFMNGINAFESFREFMTSASLSVLIDVPFILIFIAIIGWIGGPLFWVPLLIAPIIVLSSFLIRIPLSKKIDQLFNFSGEKQAILHETIVNAETIKTLNAQSKMQQKWESLLGRANKLGLKTRTLANFAINAAAFFQQSATVIVVIFGVFLITKGDLSMGGLIACTILTGRAVAPMHQISGLIMRYYQSKAAFTNVQELFKLPSDEAPISTRTGSQVLKGKVQFNNVSFHYPDQAQPTLKNISFHIEPGEKVGIIGTIGSGKTTLLKLILHLYQASNGNIYIDDKEIAQLDNQLLYKNIAYVAQEPSLFYGSIKENIAFQDPNAPIEAIENAAKLSGIHTFINKHPDGYNLQIVEQGKNLSGGQKQSVCISRAFLKNPSIVLLDEPTNTMDEYSERYFRQQMDNYLTDKTLLMITHKASMLKLVDRIIALRAGSIIADGPRDEILDQFRQKSPQ